MFEDLPIKPDQKYLESQQAKYTQRQRKSKPYLHKGQLAVLPCQAINYKNRNTIKRSRSSSPKQTKTKAQIYKQIKQKNKIKFGDWSNKPLPKQQLIKKLAPSAMTINYRPKTQINIDTRQYKKPGFTQNLVQKQSRKKKQSAESQKMQYKKMIQYMKKLYSEFQVEKSQFQKEKQYLKFKKNIQNQEGINIQTNTDMIKSKFKNQRICVKAVKDKKQQQIKQKIKSPQKQVKQNIKNVINNQISQNIHKKSHQDVQDQPNNSQSIQKFHYKVDKLHQIHPFTLSQISKYVQLQSLLPQSHQYYIEALNLTTQTNRNSPQIKVKHIKPKCTHGSIGQNHTACCHQECVQKRVTYFGNNWYQLWIPGKYRTVYNGVIGYQVVWYGNQDIKQQFSNGKIMIYASKNKRVIEVRVEGQLPFWYYPYINQLEMINKNGDREVIFADGRHQLITQQENC